MPEDYQAYVARQKAIYDTMEMGSNPVTTSNVMSDIIPNNNTPGGSSKIDPGSDINLTQEQIARRIFRALEDAVRQSDPISDGAVSQEKFLRMLVTAGLGKTAQDVSIVKIIADMKLEPVYVEGKGWCYRRKEMV